MPLSRRALVMGAGAAFLCAPAVARAAERAERRFVVTRDGEEIGAQTTRVTRAGEEVRTDVSSRIAVKILGITAYRYEQDAEVIWNGGRLERLVSETNDDGETVRASVRRTEGGLIADGSAHAGPVPEDAGATIYWAQALLARSVWLSTQSGRPLSVTCAPDGRETLELPAGPRDCARWRVRGEIDLALFYDDRGEWVGSAFDARGETGRFLMTAETGRLDALWAG